MIQKTDLLTIGMLSVRCDCKVQTIRYYEQIGLMPEPERSEGGQRRYHQGHRARLDFIRHGRELGFSLAAIQALLCLTDANGETCDAADAIAHAHLLDIKSQIRRLQSLQAELEHVLGRCEGGSVEDCRVIQKLADHRHRHCLHPAHPPASCRAESP